VQWNNAGAKTNYFAASLIRRCVTYYYGPVTCDPYVSQLVLKG
jgi:hypothetical protein